MSEQAAALATRLKFLLQQRHLQNYRSFCREYDKAARTIDPKLEGSYPSRAQFFRWLGGELSGLPYPDHCRILEKMLPGWSTQQLFELCRDNDEAVAPVERAEQRKNVVRDVSRAVHAGIAATDAPGRPESHARADSATSSTADDPAGEIAQKLLEAQQSLGLSDSELRRIAELSGNVVELDQQLSFDIDPEGWAQLTCRHELLNLSTKPLARLPRELWFENTNGPLTIRPIHGDRHRIAVQRTHNTPTMAVFACQVSPPIQPGERGVISFTCTGGRFVDQHYWRQAFPRYTQRYTIRLRIRQAEFLSSCSATQENADGTENSAEEGLVWNDEGDDVELTLSKDELRPNQSVTVRWDVAL